MTVYTKLSDDFNRHSGSLENYYQADALTLANGERHYNIREFMNEDPTVPWTTNDLRFWNAYHFNGIPMDILGRRRSIAGRIFRFRIMQELSQSTTASYDLGTYGDGTYGSSEASDVFMTMIQMDALTMDELDHVEIAAGNEEWPIQGDVVFGKNASYRYSNTIAIAIDDVATKTITSFYNDDLLTDFEDNIYNVELVIRNLPAQSAVARLDLNNSYIDFSSSLVFDPTVTDSVPFSESLNNLSSGGDTYFTIPRSRLVNCDLTDIKAIRFRLLATAAPLTTITASENLTSGNLSGTYTYKVSYVIGGTETTVRNASNAVTVTNERIDLSNIPIGPGGTTARKIYRSSGGSYELVTTIANNTATTFTDNVSAPGVAPPTSSTLANMTFTAQAMRLVPSNYSYSVIAPNTKYSALRRSMSRNGSESSSTFGRVLFKGSRPANATIYARFNSGHNPVGNDNVLRLYTRYNDTDNYIETSLSARNTQSRLRIYENIGNAVAEIFSTTINTNILDEEQDYWLVVDQDDSNISASIYIADGVWRGALVYTTGSQAIHTSERGYIGYSYEPYNYDFTLLSIAPQDLEYAHFESTPLTSVTPIVGATVFAYNSQAIDYLTDVTLDQSGDASVTTEDQITILTRTGTNWYGGMIADTPVILGDSDHAYVTGEVFPVDVVRGQLILVLADANLSVAWLQPILNLLPNQWNEFTLDIAGNLSPIPYYFYLHQTGFYADTYRLRNIKLASQSIAWEGSADSINWQPFYRALNDPYSGVKFTNRGNRAKIRATAMSDDAWLQGYELTPHYGYPGHKP
jgi:hypothetical protein